MGVTLKPDDISISHRLPANAGECRPLIVKFVRRSKKVNMMRRKRALRENPSRRGVYVNDDLTRQRLVREIKRETPVSTKCGLSTAGFSALSSMTVVKSSVLLTLWTTYLSKVGPKRKSWAWDFINFQHWDFPK